MITPTLNYEKSLWKNGYEFVCGIDEVGRGCFAGPVVVGAVIFPKNCELLKDVADSKLLRPKVRQNLELIIKERAVAWAIAEVSVFIINKVGIGKATQVAFRKAIKSLQIKTDYVLVDGFKVKQFSQRKQKAIIKGDQLCFSIAAASIIAKVYRDDLMRKLHEKYPNYGFDKHKGYGTKEHQNAIKRYGLSKIHRKSFNLEKYTI